MIRERIRLELPGQFYGAAETLKLSETRKPEEMETNLVKFLAKSRLRLLVLTLVLVGSATLGCGQRASKATHTLEVPKPYEKAVLTLREDGNHVVWLHLPDGMTAEEIFDMKRLIGPIGGYTTIAEAQALTGQPGTVVESGEFEDEGELIHDEIRRFEVDCGYVSIREQVNLDTDQRILLVVTLVPHQLSLREVVGDRTAQFLIDKKAVWCNIRVSDNTQNERISQSLDSGQLPYAREISPEGDTLRFDIQGDRITNFQL